MKIDSSAPDIAPQPLLVNELDPSRRHFLVDTGATLSAVPRRWLGLPELARVRPWEKARQSVKAANDTVMEVHGVIELEVLFGGLVHKHPFLVIDMPDALLGYDFLRIHDVTIIAAKNRLEFRCKCPPGTPALALPKHRAHPSHVPVPAYPLQKLGGLCVEAADSCGQLHPPPHGGSTPSTLQSELPSWNPSMPPHGEMSSAGRSRGTGPRVAAHRLPARPVDPAAPAQRLHPPHGVTSGAGRDQGARPRVAAHRLPARPGRPGPAPPPCARGDVSLRAPRPARWYGLSSPAPPASLLSGAYPETAQALQSLGYQG